MEVISKIHWLQRRRAGAVPFQPAINGVSLAVLTFAPSRGVMNSGGRSSRFDVPGQTMPAVSMEWWPDLSAEPSQRPGRALAFQPVQFLPEDRTEMLQRDEVEHVADVAVGG